MTIRQFEQIFASKYPISVREIRLRDKNFALQTLHTREKKGWIKNLIRGWWVLPEIATYNGYGAVISNSIYEPSYLSLERGLRYYNLIPEGVFMFTACTTKKTNQFHTQWGTFSYQTLSPKLMRGYELKTVGIYTNIRVATPEKTICDYIYLHPEIVGPEDFEEMRINSFLWDEIASQEKLLQYAQYYPKTTQKRINYFLDYITQS